MARIPFALLIELEKRAAQWLLRQPAFHSAVRRVHRSWHEIKTGEKIAPPEVQRGMEREGEKGTMHYVLEEMKNQWVDLKRSYGFGRKR